METIASIVVTVLAVAFILSIITFQFQMAVGMGVIAIGLWIFAIPFMSGRPKAPVRQAEASQASIFPPEASAMRLINIPQQVAQGDKPMKIVMAASHYFQVPPEVLMTHWYMESGMRVGGDRGGAGGHFALAQIVRKQTADNERHRWHRFRANHRDILAICAHCGYDCSQIQGSSTGALGPMQFQPSTWVMGAIDADGDNRACPLNLADAMFTAARKLHKDYSRLGNWNRAMLGYGGVNCAENRAYVRRAQPILAFFRNWLRQRGYTA